MRLRFSVLFVTFSFFVFGCGTGEDMKLASAGVSTVHSQMAAERYSEIYAQADDDFRAATKEQDFDDLMSAIHRKLGNVQSADQQGYFVNFNTSGTLIRLNFNTKFDGGDAQEEFQWRIKDKKVLLLGYHINSNTLIVK